MHQADQEIKTTHRLLRSPSESRLDASPLPDNTPERCHETDMNLSAYFKRSAVFSSQGGELLEQKVSRQQPVSANPRQVGSRRGQSSRQDEINELYADGKEAIIIERDDNCEMTKLTHRRLSEDRASRHQATQFITIEDDFRSSVHDDGGVRDSMNGSIMNRMKIKMSTLKSSSIALYEENDYQDRIQPTRQTVSVAQHCYESDHDYMLVGDVNHFFDKKKPSSTQISNSLWKLS